MLYRISIFICWCLFKIFFGLEVKGKDIFPVKGPFILASNHLSHLDPPVLAVACPRKIGFLAKEELFKNKLFAWYIKNVGSIAIKRGQSDIRVMRLALKTLKEKGLLIFPQGTRGRGFDEIKLGVGFLCKKAKVPVIVARVYGTEQVLPRGEKFFRRGRIKVIFAKVDTIRAEDSYPEIASKVMEAISSL